jgi:hypothetical protein
MRRILHEFGSDLGNGVRLDQYYPTPAAVHPYHLARHAEFCDYIPPSTSVVMERCFAAETNISTSLIAVMPEYEIHKIYPPGVGSAPSSGFVPAVVCGNAACAQAVLLGAITGSQTHGRCRLRPPRRARNWPRRVSAG